MQGYRLAGAGVFALVVSHIIVGAGQQPANLPPLVNTPRVPLAPSSPAGNSITPALEGWYRNADGTATILIGYNNRNNQPFDIPVGPNNRIEPFGWSGPKTQDYGQPTYF